MKHITYTPAEKGTLQSAMLQLIVQRRCWDGRLKRRLKICVQTVRLECVHVCVCLCVYVCACVSGWKDENALEDMCADSKT